MIICCRSSLALGHLIQAVLPKPQRGIIATVGPLVKRFCESCAVFASQGNDRAAGIQKRDLEQILALLDRLPAAAAGMG